MRWISLLGSVCLLRNWIIVNAIDTSMHQDQLNRICVSRNSTAKFVFYRRIHGRNIKVEDMVLQSG